MKESKKNSSKEKLLIKFFKNYDKMIIAGFQKTSLIDYPGKISSIVFLAGCNFRCQFCYVSQLVLPEKIKEIKGLSEDYILSYLEKNKKFIDAVVFTGGEPTLNEDLPNLIQKIKSKDFLIGLETNGSNPKMLLNLIENKLLDYVALDIKTELEFKKYKEITGILTKETFENIKKSIKILLSSSIDYEFRTTLMKEFHSTEDIIEICKSIKGAKVYYLQNFKKLNETLSKKEFTPFEKNEIEEIIEKGKEFVNIKFRG
ncbi:MAG: anaerobic ribonucleoside-triphosphate reductase activating protein [Candidatus Aenigmatarchaeota archaeon]